MIGFSGASWRKSSFSGTESNCVEVAFMAGQVAARDSKNPDGPVLIFANDEWRGFLDGVRAGEFDLPY